MKSVLKILLGLVLLVVVVIAAGGAILGIFFDPNAYKAEIEQAALDNAGIELKIGGEIGWSVFPWLGLEVNRIDAAFAGKPQLASLNKARLAVSIPALFSGQVQMQSVEVDGLRLTLVQAKDSNNWSGVAAATPTPAPDAERVAPGVAPLAVDIESIRVSNGDISFEDQVSGGRILLRDFNMKSGRIALNSLFPAELSFTAEQYAKGSVKPDLSAATALQAQFLLDPANQQYHVQGLDSSLGLQLAALGAQPLKLTLAADVAADLNRQSAALDNLKLGLAGLALSGKLALNDFAKPALKGELALSPFDLQKLLASLGQPAIETADPQVLRNVSARLSLVGPANTVTADKLTLKLDDTTFNGSAGYNLASGAITLNLQGDKLDADRYLPPAKAQPAAAPSGPAQAKAERYSKEPVIPVEPLLPLNLDARIGLQQLHIQKLDISNLLLEASAHNGLISAGKIHADLYGGTIRNSARLDLRKTPVQLAVKKDVRAVQIGDLLKAAADTDRISGSLSAQSDISARGRSVYDIVHSLNGTAAVQMADGVLQGIDMAQTLCQGLNNIASLGINAQQVDQSTPFANMGASTTIRNGVISNPDLRATLDAMSLKGKGTVDLPGEALDYRLGFTIEENLFKQTCSINNKVEGIEWPLGCKGAFDTPPAKLCKPDLSVFKELFKQQARAKLEEKHGAKLEEKKEELKQKLQEKLGGDEDVKQLLQDKLGGEEGAKKLLKGLFN